MVPGRPLTSTPCFCSGVMPCFRRATETKKTCPWGYQVREGALCMGESRCLMRALHAMHMSPQAAAASREGREGMTMGATLTFAGQRSMLAVVDT